MRQLHTLTFKALGDWRGKWVPNASGKIINLLYVDYVEYARAADVAQYLMKIAKV